MSRHRTKEDLKDLLALVYATWEWPSQAKDDMLADRLLGEPTLRTYLETLAHKRGLMP